MNVESDQTDGKTVRVRVTLNDGRIIYIDQNVLEIRGIYPHTSLELLVRLED
jgi:hypothetical protein